MTDYSELLKSAKVVRAKCYLFAHSDAAKNYFYGNEKTLKYMCAVASATLVEYLKRKGIKANCITTQRHCWVECEDYYIDLTCSQFHSFDDFMVLTKKYFWMRVKVGEFFLSYKKAKKVSKKEYDSVFRAWGGGQAPTDKVIEEILKIGERNV